jgi:hypothetical protein
LLDQSIDRSIESSTDPPNTQHRPFGSSSTYLPWHKARAARSWPVGKAPPPPPAPPPPRGRPARSGPRPRPAAAEGGQRKGGWGEKPSVRQSVDRPAVSKMCFPRDGRTTDHEVVRRGAEEVEAAAAAGDVLPVVQALQRHQRPLPQDHLLLPTVVGRLSPGYG